DIADAALLVPMHPESAQFSDSCFSGSDAWLLVGIEKSGDAAAALTDVARWRNGMSPQDLTARELSKFEKWRVPAPVNFTSMNELKLWRQSETILRMAQSREPNRSGRYNHGLIVASLPEGGWFMPWVRDMSYALLAFIRMGHQTESRWAVESFFNARPIGRVKNMVRGFEYQIPVVRYFGDGSEETNFGGENAPNVEFDNWGNVLTMLAEYVERYADTSLLSQPSVRGSVYISARDFIAKPLLGNLDPMGNGTILTKDTSVWEADSGSEQHFSYSTAAAIQGLRGFSRLARLRGDSATAADVNHQVALLEKGFRNAFIQGGFIRGTLEDNYVYNIDSAVLETINFGAIRDVATIRATMAAMEQLKMVSGGYRRIRGARQYDKQEFLFSNFNWARVYLRLGQPLMGAALVSSMVDRSVLDNGFIPEMYVSEINDEYPGAIGAPTGSTPMVGYGAGMAIIYLQERAQFRNGLRGGGI
ncbi:MAG: glycoside hydrolase family 15, partial [Bdellovibrionales bacterium]